MSAHLSHDAFIRNTVDPKIDVIDGLHDVPSADSAANSQMRDVIGNKTDTEAGDSIYSLLHSGERHIHSESFCYPNLADPVTLTGGAGAWEQGALTEIVPANAITLPFDIHWINVASVSAADNYQLDLYYGASDVHAGSLRFSRPVGSTTNSFAPMQTVLIPANSRVRARLASGTGGADTASISIHYHKY